MAAPDAAVPEQSASPSRVWLAGTIEYGSGTPMGHGGGHLDVENIANNIYVIAQEGEFSPAQFSLPRVVSLSAKFRF